MFYVHMLIFSEIVLIITYMMPYYAYIDSLKKNFNRITNISTYLRFIKIYDLHWSKTIYKNNYRECFSHINYKPVQ